MSSLFVGVGLLFLGAILGAGALIARGRRLSAQKTVKLHARSAAKVQVADNALSQVKTDFTVQGRRKDPKVQIMCVRSTGASLIRTWLSFYNHSPYPIEILSVEVELWIANFAKVSRTNIKKTLRAHQQMEDYGFQHSLTEQEIVKVAKLDKEDALKCYIEGTIFCETSFGPFTKKITMFDLSHEIAGLSMATAGQGLDIKHELDSLTGFYRRGYLEENIQQLIDSAAPDRAFSFIMIDVDDFKHINDDYGHVVGDEALAMICSAIKDVLKNKGTAIRYGGDEFCLTLECCEKEEAVFIAQQILKRVKASAIPITSEENTGKASEFIHVALSLGVTTITEPMDYKILIKRADDMLLQSKKAGKNQVMSDRRQK